MEPSRQERELPEKYVACFDSFIDFINDISIIKQKKDILSNFSLEVCCLLKLNV
jgi:hypothetical protein